MSYTLLKSIHVAFAIASLAGFVARFALMLADSAVLRARFVRIAPHVVDTVLLASAVALAWLIGAMPGRDAWLTVKIVALLVYIVLGAIALRRGRTKTVRALAGVAAIAVFAFIVAVARTKSPWGFLAG